MVFSVFTELGNHHHSLISEYFITPKRNPISIDLASYNLQLIYFFVATLNILGKRKMDKEVVVLMYNGISLSHEINVIRLVAAR